MSKVQSDRVVGNIYKTMDYEKFKVLNGARIISNSIHAKLRKSIDEAYLEKPIIVNENFEIIDGNNVFSVCQLNKLPVYYVIKVGYSIAESVRLNTVGSLWNLKDYMNYNICEKKDQYEILESMQKEYCVTLNVLLKVFAKAQGITVKEIQDNFKKGEFKVKGIANVKKFFKQLSYFDGVTSFNKNGKFINAFLDLYTYPGYEEKALKDAIKHNEDLFVKQSTKEAYLSMICDLYSSSEYSKPIYYNYESKKILECE